MKEVVLTNGNTALVDDEDFALVSQYRWYANPKRSAVYAVTQANGESIGMHRLILGLKKGDGLEGDHKDGNGLNNCRSNLRAATHAENQRNQVRRIPKHGYRGIQPQGNRWRADIHVNGQLIYLGFFRTRQEAALAYNRAALKHFGEFACLNNVTSTSDAPARTPATTARAS